MKVLFLTNIPSPYRVDFFNELGKYCDLTVLFEKNKADNREWTSDINKNYNAVFLKGRSMGNDKALCFEVIEFIRQNFDCIIIGGYSTPTGMLAIKYLSFKKIPFILSSDGGFIRHERKINYLIKKHFICSANYYLSSGKATSKYLIHYGAKKDNIFNYPFTSLYKSDVLTAPISSDEKKILRNKLNLPDGKIVICVGQMISRKGIDILLKAAENFDKNIYTYIIGGKPTDEYLKIIKDNNLKKIYFLNFMNKENLYEYYKAADLFVLPTREDIWGLVINEAMANGLPIITTNKCIAGLELINGNGYIVPTDDFNAISLMVNEILSNPVKQVNLSIKSLKIIKEYTIENMAQKTYKILKVIENEIKK
ncbi:MAG: glycosyltransferase family 4 protein [Thomasclavelia sp.]|uniref:glycosyltransferase family 4 protein n=1 Tax=Thomasclavelia sp. TaxID=3025757 RepID=UPI0039A2B11C